MLQLQVLCRLCTHLNNSDLSADIATTYDPTGSVATVVLNFKITKFNNFCNMTFNFSTSSAATNTFLQIMKIPNKYRPSTEIPFSFNDWNCKSCAGVVLTNGNVQFIQQNANVFNGCINVSWLI